MGVYVTLDRGTYELGFKATLNPGLTHGIGKG